MLRQMKTPTYPSLAPLLLLAAGALSCSADAPAGAVDPPPVSQDGDGEANPDPDLAGEGEGEGEGTLPEPASAGEGEGEGQAPGPGPAGEGEGEASGPGGSPHGAVGEGEGEGEGEPPRELQACGDADPVCPPRWRCVDDLCRFAPEGLGYRFSEIRLRVPSELAPVVNPALANNIEPDDGSPPLLNILVVTGQLSAADPARIRLLAGVGKHPEPVNGADPADTWEFNPDFGLNETQLRLQFEEYESEEFVYEMQIPPLQAGGEITIIPIVDTVAVGEFSADATVLHGNLKGAIRLGDAFNVRLFLPPPIGNTNLGTLMRDRLFIPLTIDTDDDGEPDAWPFEADFVADEVELAAE